jgi:uncharacterized repeat protein (TIGR03803 family)
VATTLVLACSAGAVRAQDSYGGGVLSIPSIIIGNAQYTDVDVTVEKLVTPPSGSGATQPGDVWEPQSGELYIAQVNVGTNIYYNAVVKVGSLLSIGSITGDDVYSGASVFLPAVQLVGGPLYTNVQILLSAQDILGVAGGMPVVSQNTYDPATHVLTIPAAECNGRYYTNVTASVNVNQVQRVLGGPQLQDTVLYSFGGGEDGSEPYVSVVQGSDGNFYGTTFYGGGGFGTVFRLTASGQEMLLHAFQGGTSDGAGPYAALVQGANGSFYGTTTGGGTYNQGTVFEISPDGQETVLWSFTGGTGGVAGSVDGSSPNGLVLASDGNLYGTTTFGGATNNGVVFRITPQGAEQPLYSFQGGPGDGANPQAALVQGSDGSLYGTTEAGGSNYSGTIFRSTLSGAVTLLHSFGVTADGSDASFPLANLIQASDGNFYGTSLSGGTYNVGAVFRYDPVAGAESVLYSFSGDGGVAGSSDGANPYAGVIQASDGNLYGAVNNGGAYNVGTVFRLTLGGQETTLYSFSGDGVSTSNDGANPNAVIQGMDGNLYGTAYLGGSANNGAVFRLAGAVP